MVAATVNVYEAKTRLSALLARVEAGEEIVIARNGRPVARLTAVHSEGPDRISGEWAGQVEISPDFDDLSAEDLADWYGSSTSR